MDYLQLVSSMTPDIYRGLLRAVEIGKWPDGRVLTSAQRGEALQAVIAWSKLNLPPDEQIGFIDRGDKAGDSCDDPGEVALKWQE
jgi:uncharacterized protein YeaC (DUF1315 family)